MRRSHNLQKNTKITYFEGSGSFKVIDVDTTELLVIISNMSVPI